MTTYDVIILGGGLAGLTAALHLGANNRKVLVIEKNSYPNHKVCGEYVSNEVNPYLASLGVDLTVGKAVTIDTLQMSTIQGRSIEVDLPLGGFGISRFAFDMLLFEEARRKQIDFCFDTGTDITFHNGFFQVLTSSNTKYGSKVVIGAFGKRSSLDKKLDRVFIHQKSPWLGVKCHYDFDDFPSNVVALHNFPGGYGGLSRTEDGSVNFCYLATYESFKFLGNIKEYNNHNVARNPFLRTFLKDAVPKFEKPISIAQIAFDKKQPVEKHILMCGDSAGLIHPLCGNGMAMAIHGAKLASEAVLDFLDGSIDRAEMEDCYSKSWKKAFQKRLWMGRRMQSLLMDPTASKIAINTFAKSQRLLKMMIRNTHGKPILV